MDICAMILAEGSEDAMRSERSRMLHDLCGRPLIAWLSASLADAGAEDQLFLVGGRQGQIRGALGEDHIYVFADTDEIRRSTIMQASSFLESRTGITIVVPGDAPMLRTETLRMAVESFTERKAKIMLMTAETRRFTDARVVNSLPDGRVESLQVRRNSTGTRMREIDAGVYLFDTAFLLSSLGRMCSKDAGLAFDAAELIEFVMNGGETVYRFGIPYDEALKVRNRVDLERARRSMNLRICERHMLDGVSIENPDTCLIETGVQIESDVLISASCRLTGNTVVQSGTVLGPRVHLHNTLVGSECRIDGGYYCDSVLADGCAVGPGANFDNGVRIGRGSGIGNNVQLSDSSIGSFCTIGSRVFLSRVEVDDEVRIGNGTVVVPPLEQHEETRFMATDYSHIGSGARIGDLSRMYAPFEIRAASKIQPGSIVNPAKRPILPWAGKNRKYSKVLPEPVLAAEDGEKKRERAEQVSAGPGKGTASMRRRTQILDDLPGQLPPELREDPDKAENKA